MWDAPRKQAIQRAPSAAPARAGAERAWPRVEPALDRYAAELGRDAHRLVRGDPRARRAVGGAARPAGPSASIERLAELRALTDLFLLAPTPPRCRARCRRPDSLSRSTSAPTPAALREVVPPPATRPRARAPTSCASGWRGVRALMATGKYARALEPAGALAAEARALGYRPLEAEALVHLGRLQRANDKLAEAEETLYDAIAAGEAGRNARRHRRGLARAPVAWSATRAERFEEARRLARVARGAIERAGRDTRAEAQLEDGSA